jgi:uroporphyrin-III C-methyltransferase/precorrin-2 dehydrogenase/sirohydrochlorin ferrochelatase
MKPLFPVFLKLDGRDVLLVGGGAVAAGKLRDLIAAGARVTVVSPQVHPDITSHDGVIIAQRPFVPRDLDTAGFVIAAATPEVNRQVAVAAAERRVFANVVDDAEQATVYTGGVLRRGGVTIAVSTEGQAPALAGLLREGLDAVVPAEIDTWVAAARELRREQRAAGVPMADRRPRLLAALNQLYEGRLATAEVRS